MGILETIGWNEDRKSELTALGSPDLEPGRVAAADRGEYLLLCERGEVHAETSGRMLHEARTALDLPAVGDWTAFRFNGDRGAIEAILPRSSCLMRKTSGREYAAQIIGANLDRIFIVTSVGRDFNPRRIERYLAASFSAGAAPMVVVNKRDLPHDRGEIMDRLGSVALTVDVIMTSAVEDDGLDEMEGRILPGETIALVGSSGAGKSSIANRLLGAERQGTRSIREFDGKGRHMTTRRELIVVEDRFAVIDSPGMREFSPWDAGDGIDEVFPEIVELAASCRFRDCSHTSEPGCAVVGAVEDGLLPRVKLDSYLRLKSEQAVNAEKSVVRDGKETKRRWKQVHKDMRKLRKIHKKLGLKHGRD